MSAAMGKSPINGQQIMCKSKLLFLTVNTLLVASLAHLSQASDHNHNLIQHHHHHQQQQEHRQAVTKRLQEVDSTQEQQPTSPQQYQQVGTTTTKTTTTSDDKTQTTTTTMTNSMSLQHNGGETSALVYLQRYGYMQPPVGTSNNHLISEESFSAAIADFQRFAGLPATGQADNQTLELMRMPRCGNIDRQPPVGAATARGAITKPVGKLSARARRRVRRYALQGSKWRRQELTYRISQYPTKFAGARRHEVEAQIERAFGIWSQVAPIDFVVKREGRVHIDIRFASGDHGDGDAFDGPGNTLAHAYFPQYGGDAHFDDQEYWTVDSYAGTNIFQVAAHELGHSLGLGHSNVREALMAPFYQKYKPNFKLHLDDVLAIQALYGEKVERSIPTTPASITTTTASTTTSEQPPVTQTHARPTFGRHPPIYKGKRRPTFGRGDSDTGDETSTTTAAPPTSGEEGVAGLPELPTNGIDETATPTPTSTTTTTIGPADLCQDSSLDAITRTEDGSTYVFKGDHYWLLTNEGLARGYPRPISADWEGLPSQLDAALTWADGKTFFFKGNKYWRFRNRRRDLGYPKLISAGFAGIPDDVDAALVWSGNGRTYFFKGAEYWRFDSKADPPVSQEYPRSVRVWLGVPAHLNAAFKWENNVTYFFKGDQYYRFNDREFKVESRGRPAFPRPTAEWWFGCVNSNLAQRALPAAGAGFGSRAHAGEQSALVGVVPRSLTAPRAASLQHADGAGASHSHSDTSPSGQSGGGGGSDEWSLLAFRGEHAPRPMGTHISDSDHTGGSTEPLGGGGSAQGTPPGESGEQEAGQEAPAGRAEPLDAQFLATINKRLGSAGSGESPQLPANLEQTFRIGSGASGQSQVGSASSSSTSAISILPHAQTTPAAHTTTRLLIFMCTLIATASTSLAHLRQRRLYWPSGRRVRAGS